MNLQYLTHPKFLLCGDIMKGIERREKISQMLRDSDMPLSGTYLAKILDVSRQVIVQDIAILRAEGREIMATPQGYIIPDYPARYSARRIIACVHTRTGIKDELTTIIAMGGRVLDVIVEHPLYGEIRGNLMLNSIYDVEEFCKKLENGTGQPLLLLTNGIHLHTIEADIESKLDMIEDKLRSKGYIIDTEI
jgi:transcriptional regulator of NAD metabolism